MGPLEPSFEPIQDGLWAEAARRAHEYEIVLASEAIRAVNGTLYNADGQRICDTVGSAPRLEYRINEEDDRVEFRWPSAGPKFKPEPEPEQEQDYEIDDAAFDALFNA